MKVIDLLNKIANGEEVPKRIKVNDIEFEIYTESSNIDYQLANGQSTYLFQDYIHGYGEIKFNDEVEIIEEEKDIEELNLDKDELLKNVVITAQDYVIEGKINELIKAVNKLILESRK